MRKDTVLRGSRRRSREATKAWAAGAKRHRATESFRSGAYRDRAASAGAMCYVPASTDGAAGPLRGPRGRRGRRRPRKSRAPSRSWPPSTTPTATRTTPAAHERFKEINLAYQVLSDDEPPRHVRPLRPPGRGARLAVRVRAARSRGASSTSATSPSTASWAICSASSASAGATRATSSASSRSTFEEAAFGCEKSLRYERVVSCTDCRGSGRRGRDGRPRRAAPATGAVACASSRASSPSRSSGRARGAAARAAPCATRARVPRQRPRHRRPRRSRSRSRRASSRRDQARATAPATSRAPTRRRATSEITITVRAAPVLPARGRRRLCTVPVTFTHAALGGEVEVPTLDGKGKLRVPAGTQPGTRPAHQGQGHPAARWASAGATSASRWPSRCRRSSPTKQRELLEAAREGARRGRRSPCARAS